MYLFALVGLKEAQMPNEIETEVLTSFIKANYKNYRLEEIKIAFEMAIKQEFKAETNHYGSFSVLYFANIMNGYKFSREKAGAEIMRIEAKKKAEIEQELTDLELLKIKQEFDEIIVKPMYKKFKTTGKLDFGITKPLYVYNSLIEKHPEKLNAEEKKEIKIQAIKNIQQRLENIHNQKSISTEDYEKKKSWIELMQIPEKQDDEVKVECYRIAVKQIFNKIKTL